MTSRASIEQMKRNMNGRKVACTGVKILVFSFLFVAQQLHPQEDKQEKSESTDDLFDELDDITTEADKSVIATFKSTRLMLAQSTERVQTKQLHFRISHVFSRIEGIGNFYGLDNLNNMHLSFEYGLTDRIQLGLFRSNKPDKTYSLNAKVSLLRQKSDGSMPVFISYYGDVDIKTRTYVPEARNDDFSGRLDYIHQLLISRKFTDRLSLQLSPTWVHRNLTDTASEPNDVYSIGAGGRYLFTPGTSVNVEYFYALPTFDSYELNQNALSIGFDIETGGHVFQLYFTNAFALHPGKFALNQNGKFFQGDISFGFSILREFNL